MKRYQCGLCLLLAGFFTLFSNSCFAKGFFSNDTVFLVTNVEFENMVSNLERDRKLCLFTARKDPIRSLEGITIEEVAFYWKTSGDPMIDRRDIAKFCKAAGIEFKDKDLRSLSGNNIFADPLKAPKILIAPSYFDQEDSAKLIVTSKAIRTIAYICSFFITLVLLCYGMVRASQPDQNDVHFHLTWKWVLVRLAFVIAVTSAILFINNQYYTINMGGGMALIAIPVFGAICYLVGYVSQRFLLRRISPSDLAETRERLKKLREQEREREIDTKRRKYKNQCLICAKSVSLHSEVPFFCTDCGFSGVVHDSCRRAGIPNRGAALTFGSAVRVKCPICGAST